MLRTLTIAITLNFVANIVLASELEIILEWEGTIHTTSEEVSEKYCIDFPGETNDIKEFFTQAEVIEQSSQPSVMCSANGVAKTKNGKTVDWWLFQGGTGYIISGDTRKDYICKDGTECCKNLPHICTKQP